MSWKLFCCNISIRIAYKWHHSRISLCISKTGTTQTAGARNTGGNFIGQLCISVVPHWKTLTSSIKTIYVYCSKVVYMCNVQYTNMYFESTLQYTNVSLTWPVTSIEQYAKYRSINIATTLHTHSHYIYSGFAVDHIACERRDFLPLRILRQCVLSMCVRLANDGCLSGVSLNPIKGSHCFIEQETLPFCSHWRCSMWLTLRSNKLSYQ